MRYNNLQLNSKRFSLNIRAIDSGLHNYPQNKISEQKSPEYKNPNLFSVDNAHLLMNSLNSLSRINSLSFKSNEGFEINLSLEELEKRTSKKHFGAYKLLNKDDAHYKNLDEGDKLALKHLVKAANILDDVYLKQDNKDNIKFRAFLVEESEKGNKKAQKALILFNGQKGVTSVDKEGNQVRLMKNSTERPGKNFFPPDLSAEEFQNILIKMLKQGRKKDVSDILSTRTIVVREGEDLKGIDYTQYFKKEFQAAAKEIEKAAKTSTNKDFKTFLTLQALALRENNVLNDAKADIVWADMQDTPLEFTIVRENYDDKLTPAVFENPELLALLNENRITPQPKDTLGARVGIVNKEGCENLLRLKKYLPEMAQNMPFNDEYEQYFSSGKVKQTMVDADLVALSGRLGAFRSKITVAENLPNNDKLSLSMGGGKRNVYHRQIRLRGHIEPEKLPKKLDAILAKDLHKYYDMNSLHQFVILHENVHSLGLKEGKEKLGTYNHLIEENKADMGAIYFLHHLTEKGVYTSEEEKKIITSAVTNYFFKSAPPPTDAHRVRNLMQNNFLIENGAVNVDTQGKINIDFEKITPACKKMLDMDMRIQIDGDQKKAKELVDKYFVWTPEIERVAANLREIDTEYACEVISPLADSLSVRE